MRIWKNNDDRMACMQKQGERRLDGWLDTFWIFWNSKFERWIAGTTHHLLIFYRSCDDGDRLEHSNDDIDNCTTFCDDVEGRGWNDHPPNGGPGAVRRACRRSFRDAAGRH